MGRVGGLLIALLSLFLAACQPGTAEQPGTPSPTDSPVSTAAAPPTAGHTTAHPVPEQFRNPLPGMPPIVGGSVYGAVRPGQVADRIADEPAYLYVPNSYGEPITTVIDQRTHKVVRILHTGEMSQHVTPSYDLSTLYVEASDDNSLVAIDPATGRITGRVHVVQPYNLYFTPDGKSAIVMEEDDDRIVFTDPVRFRTEDVIQDPGCQGPNHADFTANGRFFLVTCEFSGPILKISTLERTVVDRLSLGSASKPQDVRLAPNGLSFFVADMDRNLLLEIPWDRLEVTGETTMPAMPHGIYPSRDGRFLYVSSRMAGTVSVFSLARRKIVDTWRIPGGGSPDMGGVSADGRTLWLSGRLSGDVYGWDTRTGELIAKIHVGGSPHGLLVWPQPGRYSLGHTGNLR